MMDEMTGNNYCMLRGELEEAPTFSHESRGERFYRFALNVHRLSGAVDTVHILARQQLLEQIDRMEAEKICVIGELRSFNNKSGSGPRLVLNVFAKEIRFENGDDTNEVILNGTICKQPVLRTTPMGREICDLMLAVNRRYGRSDYLPCIAWGGAAHEAAHWEVGTAARLTGRLQSRKYTKLMEGVSVEKTAYEVSVLRLEEM